MRDPLQRKSGLIGTPCYSERPEVAHAPPFPGSGGAPVVNDRRYQVCSDCITLYPWSQGGGASLMFRV